MQLLSLLLSKAFAVFKTAFGLKTPTLDFEACVMARTWWRSPARTGGKSTVLDNMHPFTMPSRVATAGAGGSATTTTCTFPKARRTRPGPEGRCYRTQVVIRLNGRQNGGLSEHSGG